MLLPCGCSCKKRGHGCRDRKNRTSPSRNLSKESRYTSSFIRSWKEDVATITEDQYGQTLEKYPRLDQLYTLAKEFHTVMFSQKPEKLDTWIKSAQKYDIPELQSFIEGICNDIEAAKNGIGHSYNNGLAEGSVNKIKVIKRIMYVRNSFTFLKAKVLFHELFYAEFN